LVGFWSAPQAADLEEFERYYLEHHIPLTATLPGLRRFVCVRAEPGPDGSAPPYHRVAELHFDSPEAFAEATRTPEWTAIFADGAHLEERFGVTGSAGFGVAQEVPLA